MTSKSADNQGSHTTTLWLDPVCPFSWNTARWLASVADVSGFTVELRMMSLAVLNEGRDLPAPQQARMIDSRRIGRLMTVLQNELGSEALWPAYFAFAEKYFEQSVQVGDELVEHVVHAVGAQGITATALDDASMDGAVATSHHASQAALGDTAGSPLLTINGRTVFGPVLTTAPDAAAAPALFDAVSALVAAPEFSELSRPRNHP